MLAAAGFPVSESDVQAAAQAATPPKSRKRSWKDYAGVYALECPHDPPQAILQRRADFAGRLWETYCTLWKLALLVEQQTQEDQEVLELLSEGMEPLREPPRVRYFFGSVELLASYLQVSPDSCRILLNHLTRLKLIARGRHYTTAQVLTGGENWERENRTITDGTIFAVLVNPQDAGTGPDLTIPYAEAHAQYRNVNLDVLEKKTVWRLTQEMHETRGSFKCGQSLKGKAREVLENHTLNWNKNKNTTLSMMPLDCEKSIAHEKNPLEAEEPLPDIKTFSLESLKAATGHKRTREVARLARSIQRYLEDGKSYHFYTKLLWGVVWSHRQGLDYWEYVITLLRRVVEEAQLRRMELNLPEQFQTHSKPAVFCSLLKKEGLYNLLIRNELLVAA
ncbi:hypothetical protein DC3_54710 [Deinococcus cellulosilyticus NBRC 106333 = KACC 11606]|uniref:Uncharacterized protein n=2 Tax=Deinococcus cellulosilyticus TaxID=401558 RepID=A0A511NBA2_DEIC1|nr:hypothetical protein DC3_54710 [Deinococcus cellulosilyticus NBRC 106333 = KACC 11606]